MASYRPQRGLKTLMQKVDDCCRAYKARYIVLRRNSGKTKIGDVTVDSLLGGMRGLKGLLCQTSELDPNEGITFRNQSIPEIEERFPKRDSQPLPEGILHLMLTGEQPTDKDVRDMSLTLYSRARTMPKHVETLIRSLPKTMHPMTQLSIGLMALQEESHFFRAYNEGVKKQDLWKSTYEDALDLIARIPIIAALIYQVKFKDGILPQMDPNLDWAANYGVMLGYEDTKFHELMRLYMFLHCDHEGGNVSAHATHLVGSALSDPYISFAAGVNGLAGPLHGAANAETLKFLLEIVNVYGPHPTKQQVIEFVHDILDGGRVIPGYGHAVLKKTDPRFTSQAKFAREYLPEDPMCRLVAICYEVIPQILMDTGKVANPWPNVDAHSGALLHHFGLVQFDYFTVLFAVSRSIGCMCNLILDRYLGLPIERPKSVTFERLEEDISNAAI